jgi:hypothetical protein
MKLYELYEGWKNHLLPEDRLVKIINETSKQRLKICKGCPLHSTNKEGYVTIRLDEHCTECGCTLIAKTKCLACECPVGEWKAIEEYKTIKNGEQ